MTDGAENTIIAYTASIYPFSYSGTIIRPGAAPESGLKGVQRVMAKEYKLSPQRLKELQDEMNYLKTVREKEVAELIKEARSFGDLSENSEYDEAKNEQGKLYSRMAEIEEILKTLSEDASYGVILRAKGMLEDENGVWTYFDMVPEEYELRDGNPEYTGRICVIGSKMDEEKLEKLWFERG